MGQNRSVRRGNLWPLVAVFVILVALVGCGYVDGESTATEQTRAEGGSARIASYVAPEIFPDLATLSAASPGEAVAYAVLNRNARAAWPDGTRVTIYGGAERRRLDAVVLGSTGNVLQGDFVDVAGVHGTFTVPADLAPAHGRAIEVWAEVEPGGVRTPSMLLYVEGGPRRLPAGGGVAGLTVATGALGLLALGAASRGFHRRRGQMKTGGNNEK